MLVLLGLVGMFSCKSSSPDITTKKTMKRNNFTVNVLDFGAKGDGKTDDSKAFQAAIDHIEANNLNALYVPQMRFYFDKPVVIRRGGIRIYGDGGLTYCSYNYGWYITGNPKLKYLFEFAETKNSEERSNGLEFSGVNFFGQNQYTGIKSAIKVTRSRPATRPFLVEKCSFTGFDRAIWFKSTDKNNNYTLAFVNIISNIFYQNRFAIYASTGVLGFRFERNESEGGGRLYGKIWGDIWIANNNFEGQPNPIELFSHSEGNVFLGYNYFEANTVKDFAVRLSYESVRSKLTLENNYNMHNEGSNFLWVSGMCVKYQGVGQTSHMLMGDLKVKSPQFLTGTDLGKNGGFFFPADLPEKYFLIAGLDLDNYTNVAKLDQGTEELLIEGEKIIGGDLIERPIERKRQKVKKIDSTKKLTSIFKKTFSYKKGDLLLLSCPVRYTEYKKDFEELLIQLKNEKGENIGFSYYKSFYNTAGEWHMIFGALKAEQSGKEIHLYMYPFTKKERSGSFEIGSIYLTKKPANTECIVRPYFLENN